MACRLACAMGVGDWRKIVWTDNSFFEIPKVGELTPKPPKPPILGVDPPNLVDGATFGKVRAKGRVQNCYQTFLAPKHFFPHHQLTEPENFSIGSGDQGPSGAK
ncbi:uncharacterized protein PGTG_19690 [Puccinia graminis f. sp. tritici CRL 75-36-700-3]|uniref:Uncharacterized protein n=1 Tax=Puccinia graminis f. sp. tritici (strain CRL 75-36-700-3 / race SCCL) TaxID=418459 RepID=E3LAZ6_PUCGT|nr:uncharacterized protein PGTG_19690 [Puccinia graminis f. sp. tritici CRL 75-36-700-3]EFP93721.1 hypothetical protein PGTG_19690 [Puccinia graminis f. sp. tritici CRL 75-36-700-3]